MKEDFETLSAFQKAVSTKNIATTLREIALEWQCHVDEIEFDILEVATFHGEEKIDFVSNRLDYLVDGDHLKPIFQMYHILCYKRAAAMEKDIPVSLAANSDITKIYAAIMAHTTISSEQYSKDSFRELIYKKMLLNRVLIGTWSRSLEESIDKIFAVVNKRQELKLLKDLKFPIALGKDFVPDNAEKMIRHFETKKTEEKSLERVNYAKRDFIKSVKKGELLIEYYFHKKGSHGRNCRGEVFGQVKKEPDDMMIPAVDEATITIDMHKEGINYYAKKGGYINVDEPVLTVKDSLDLASVSFKNTGDIDGLQGENVNVTIGTDPNSVHDAVGMGVTVEAEIIHIRGNTGSRSLLRGKRVVVEGKTHQKSSIYCDNADINIHTGSLVAKNATIAFLEMGEVRGDKVTIDDLFTGSVLAREVVVHKLHSNSKITASHMIRIDTIEGSENFIKVDNQDHKKRVESLNEKILVEQQKINMLTRIYDEKIDYKERQEEAFKESLSMFRDYRKRGRKAPPTLVEKIKNFREIDTEIRKVVLEIKEHNMTLELLQGSMSSLEADLLESRIIIGKMEAGHNTIEFNLHASRKTFKQEARPFTTYRVAKDFSGDYEVRVESYIEG